MVLYTTFSPGEVAAAAVVFPVVGALLVVLRIYTRTKMVKKLGIEDWLVFPALAFMTGMGIASIVGVATKSEGYGTPSVKGPEQTYTESTVEHVFWSTELLQPLALGCIKLSFMFFYRRIFNVDGVTKSFNIISLGSIILMAIWMFGFFLAVMLLCPGHVDAYWGPAAGRAKYCWDTRKFLYALCWSDVGTDLIVLLMPIPSVLQLHLPTRKKVAIVGVFALGALTVAASITRAIFYVQLLNTEDTEVATLDPNMLNTNGIYWMLVETGLALIAVNLPLLYGLVKQASIESVIRSVRSFASIRSQNSNSRNASSQKIAPTPKNDSESQEYVDHIELVSGVKYNSNTKSISAESLGDIDVEAGNIEITRPNEVDPRHE